MSSKEIKEIKMLEKITSKFMHMPLNNSEDVVNLGYTLIGLFPEAFKHVMGEWVDHVDRLLNRLEPCSQKFADQFSRRGLSFSELKIVKGQEIPESDYRFYRVFDYLYITDRIELLKFRSELDDEVEDFENYISVLSNYLKTEIPVLNNFFFKRKIPLYFPIPSLNLHAYMVGKSGAGKSELLKIPFYDLQRKSQKKRSMSLVLIEPHGDLATQVLRFKMNSGPGRGRVILIDPAIRDTAKQVFEEDILGEEYTFVINPFDIKDRSEKSITYMVQELGSALYEILGDERTSQMKAILNACLDTLYRQDGEKTYTLSDLKRFMDDNQNQDLLELGKKNPNPEYRQFFQSKFNDNRLLSTKSSIYFKLQSIIGNPQFRRMMVGKSTIDLEKELNSGKVLIFNLSKGRMGKDDGPAYGKLLIAMIQGIMRRRQDIQEDKRKRTFLFIDEFQNYVTPTIKEVMAESRKYGLHLFLANQVIGQSMDPEMRRIILGNTAIKIASHNEPETMEIMGKQMGGLKIRDFEKLPKYSFYLYDSSNPMRGNLVLKSPPFLLDQDGPYYMGKEEYKSLFRYIATKSGYYKKVEDPNKSFEELENVQEEPVYNPNFKS